MDYECSDCGREFENDDDNDAIGAVCPSCSSDNVRCTEFDSDDSDDE